MRNWSLRLRIFLFFALLAIGGSLIVAAALWSARARAATMALDSALLAAWILASFGITALTAWIWLLFDDNVAKPVVRLASELRARAHAGVSREIDCADARYLGDLAPAAQAAASDLREVRNQLDEVVARETEAVRLEKARLEVILRDFPAGVLLCNARHRIVLYNHHAVALLRAAGEIGLNRSVFDMLASGPIEHVHARLRQSTIDDSAELVCVTSDGKRLLQSHMRLLEGGTAEAAGDAGYLLTLSDVTARMRANAERDRLLRTMVEQVRRPTTNMRTVLDVLENDYDVDEAARAALRQALVRELDQLVEHLGDFERRYESVRAAWWTLVEIVASDIGDALAARLTADAIVLRPQALPLLIRCDSFAIVELLSAMVVALRGDQGVAEFDFRIDADGDGAILELAWRGEPVNVEKIDGWLNEPLRGGFGGQSGRDVLDRHGTELWPEASRDGDARLRLPIREARPLAHQAQPEKPKEFFDFSLLETNLARIDDERPLDQITYVVFDTETTGLFPDQGDEIVQIAAVRIVNKRLLSGETLDRLVHPRRSIPASSTKVHGITEAMVADAPAIDVVGRQFHRFCADAVLVAHNAPFDMAFLKRHEAAIGAVFGQPILDTILLSAILFGTHAEHSLDALAKRLGIEIADADRHTARGDAIATAQALLTMIPMLQKAGLTTLGALVREFRKHKRLIELPARG